MRASFEVRVAAVVGGARVVGGSGPAAGATVPVPGTGDAATGSRPRSSVGRTGFVPDERPARRFPHVAVTHVGHDPSAMRSTRAAGTAARPAHHATLARAHAGLVGALHATHPRSAGGDGPS